jgi:anti-anti-sigma factor
MAALSIPSPRLRIEVTRGRTRVTFLGAHLEPADIAALAEHLAGKRGRPLLLLNLSGVEYLTAATLTALVSLSRGVRASRGCLAVENAGALVFEVFAVTGLAGLLNVRREILPAAAEPCGTLAQAAHGCGLV